MEPCGLFIYLKFAYFFLKIVNKLGSKKEAWCYSYPNHMAITAIQCDSADVLNTCVYIWVSLAVGYVRRWSMREGRNRGKALCAKDVLEPHSLRKKNWVRMWKWLS